MTERTPLYESALKVANIMRDRSIPPAEKDKRIEKIVFEVEERRESFIEFQIMLSEAIRFLAQDQKGI